MASAGFAPGRTAAAWLQAPVWLCLILGVAVAIKTVHGPLKKTVYPVFAGGAQHWWADQPLYANHLDGTGGFRYSPAFAVFMTPFAWLDPALGSTLWSWFNLAFCFFALRRLARDVLPGSWPPLRETAFMVLGLVGSVRCIWNAQANTLVIGLLMLAASGVVRRRWWAAAFCLAAAVLLKVSPIAVALLFIALWPRRLAGRFALAMLVGLAVPFLTRPPAIVLDQYQGWIAQLTGSRDDRLPGLRDAWTIVVLGENLFRSELDQAPFWAPITDRGYRAAQLLAALAVGAWCLWQQRRGASTCCLLTATLAMGTAWLMLFGPATEFPTFVLLAPLTAWAMLDAFDRRRGQGLATAAWFLTTLLPYFERTAPGVPLLLVALPVGTALFIFWLAVYSGREEETAGPAKLVTEG